jgi:two-component system, chemotaxis family, protein-glutamate methylesterase/glutaminase
MSQAAIARARPPVVAPDQPAAPPGVAQARRLRVMVVDDAVVVRGLVTRWLSEAPGIEVVASNRTGAEAVAAVERACPDIVILDLDMPDMDGLTALPLLLEKQPGLSVIVASTQTTRGADVSLRCLQLGAVDYLAKPSTNREVTVSAEFRKSLVEKVLALGQRLLRPAAAARPLAALAGSPAAPAQLRPFSKNRSEVLVIGASTGGPNAILDLLATCRPVLDRVPVIIAQHMPQTFTAMFAEHLRRRLSVDASEAVHGDLIEAGRILVAPGGHHTLVGREHGRLRVVLDAGPAVNFCRPSVDVTFASVARSCGAGVLGVVLTGMGSDGARGAAEIVERGGNIIAQDEASSIVWGMPGTVAKAGLCASIKPVQGLAAIIVDRLAGGRR